MTLFAPFYEFGEEESLALRRKLWVYLAIGVLSLAIHAFGRFFAVEISPSAIAIALVASLGFALLIYLILEDSRLLSLRESLKNWQFPIALGLALIGFWLGSREDRDLFYIHASLIYLPFAVMLYSQLFYERALSWQSLIILILALILLSSIVRILGLSYYPQQEWNDEPWVFGFVLHHQEHGVLGDALYYARDVDLPFALLPLAYWLRFFDASYWASRLFHFVLFLPFVGLMGLAAYHLYGKRMAILTMLVTFSLNTLYWSLHLRYDLEFLVFIAASLAAYAYALKRESLLWHGIAGSLLGMSLFAHYHAVGIGPMLTIALYLPLYFAKFRQQESISNQAIVYFMLGGLLGASFAFVTNILPSLEAASGFRVWRGVTDIWQIPIVAFRYFFVSRQFMFEQLFGLLAIALLLYKNTAKDKVLLAYLLLGPVAIAIMERGGYYPYIQHVAPAFALLIARGFDKFLELFPQTEITNSIVIAFLIIVPMLGDSSPVFVLEENLPLDREAPPTVQWIRENIEEGSIIVGPNWYYFWLYKDYEHYASRSWIYLSPHVRESYATEMEYWDSLAPDVIIHADDDTFTPPNIERLVPVDYLESRDYQLYQLQELTIFIEQEDSVSIYYQDDALIRPIEGD